MQIATIVIHFLESLVWPAVVVFILIRFQSDLRDIFNRIRKAELPGGISIETFPQDISETKKLSVKVKQEIEEKKEVEGKQFSELPLTEANKRMLSLELSPSPSGLELSYYQSLADQDPNLALAGLRMEVETMLGNLAKGFKVDIVHNKGAIAIARKLREDGAITAKQAELISNIVNLCSAGIHGLPVTAFQVREILDIAEVLRDDYIMWLSWGFRE